MSEGKLYLCATPIGNLGDITGRVRDTLAAAAAVYCEDTRHSRILLDRLGVAAPLISCHEHNEERRAAEIAERVAAGETVAYVSDAGMPGISDPGARLVRAMAERGLPVAVLPGASAALTAAVLSALPADDICFLGFLPRDAGERRDKLAAFAAVPALMIIYESPLRVSATCAELAAVWGDRPAALCRELTKLHEECVRAPLTALAATYADTPPKGECVLAVAAAPAAAPDADGAAAMLRELLDSGVSRRDAVRRVAAVTGVPRNEVYDLLLFHEKEK